jgi:murein DD-endopeptidase MepM/ murein hydrolase activator NlpD
MQLGLRLGLLAWGNRDRLGPAMLLVVAGVLALPLALALVVVAAFAAAVPAAPAPAGPEGASRPLPAWVVTQPYGCTGFGFEPPRGACAHFHFGIDLVAPAGTPVRAALPGRVEVLLPTGFGGGYGLHVVVHHGGGLDTMYAHLSGIAVASGQVVAAGTVVGFEGSTGMSTGPHLHFEVREAGVAVDPRHVFPGIFGPEGPTR